VLFVAARWMGRGARPEFEHDVLVTPWYRPLGFHYRHRRSATNRNPF
jgi:hypothetical protein